AGGYRRNRGLSRVARRQLHHRGRHSARRRHGALNRQEHQVSAAIIKPFEFSLDPADVADLRDRLARTRWTDWLPDTGWSYGTDETYIKRLCGYWQDGFDFEAFAARINAFPQFLADVDGEQLHFYHVRSPVPTARPLVLVHG